MKDKELLLKDLCARLPYKVKAQYFDAESERYEIDIIDGIDLTGNPEILISQYGLKVDAIKPYLRPMSSMTEEENTWADADYSYNKLTYGIDYAIVCYVDYLYSIHVDCHGLIPKGLALEAPEGMYDTKHE